MRRLAYVPFALSVGALIQMLFAAGAAAEEAAEAGAHGSRPVCERRAEPANAEPEALRPAGAASPAAARPAEAVLPEAARPMALPTPLDLSSVELVDEEAYSDVFRILKEENSCSRFFGGPAKAVEVFNHFSRELRGKALGDAATAVRMAGSYTLYRNQRTGVTYRLFEDAAVNTSGPFASRVMSAGPLSRMMVGRFPAQSRQARALIMLHELGHLVEGEGGAWLLPNDGNDPRMSDRNTREVERRCVKQLLALGG
ncbi:MAG TPA: hypothetical protein VD968_07510 [Pyrinomonadaceae bacterium]|nr:hypothetical protein [Pyrinomonadaceae bacterium]